MLLPHYYEFDDPLRVTLSEPDARVHGIPEVVIQDIWRSLRFEHLNLRTTTGEPVLIIAPGQLNTDGGPDFSGSRLRIGEIEWTGDVEIHRTSGEWFEHRHDEDPRYNRVVLHAALLGDRHTGNLTREDGTLLVEVVLYPYLADSLRSLLHAFYSRAASGLYCHNLWHTTPPEIRAEWTRHLGRERLRQKASRLADDFLTRPDPEQLLYERVFRGLGYAPNAEPMQRLARLVPLANVRQCDGLADIEALLFGTAGLLPTPARLLHADRKTADYSMDLIDRFERIRQSDAPVMSASEWQFFRLRPANFPTRRIAQAAALLAPGALLRHDPIGGLARAASASRPITALRLLLTEPRPSDFWLDHTTLERPAKRQRSASIGKGRADELLANAVLPVLLLQAEQTGDPGAEVRLLALFEKLPGGSDEITRLYTGESGSPANAVEAQGLQALHRDYCAEARCLSCRVGEWLLGTQPS
jgi:hypothetical protein